MKLITSAITWSFIIGALLYNTFHHWLPPIVVGSMIFVLMIFNFKSKPDKIINSRGYVVLTKYRQPEHRYIATQILGRKLKSNEVVHHINGNKTDNEVTNLCLMEREKHEVFHSWLRWKKEKSGDYPTIFDQKRILVHEYGGTLLERCTRSKSSSPKDKRERNEQVSSSDIAKKLFDKLREERRKLAIERNIPIYMVFDNRTLTEISEAMPESESAMLRITGVGPIKFKMYGESFISVIKIFKKELDSNSSQKQDA